MAVVSETQAQRLSRASNLSAAQIVQVVEVAVRHNWAARAGLSVATDGVADIVLRLDIDWRQWSMHRQLALEADLRRLGLNPKLVNTSIDASWLRCGKPPISPQVLAQATAEQQRLTNSTGLVDWTAKIDNLGACFS